MAITFILFFIQQFAISNVECTCSYPIFYADLSRTIEAPCTLPTILNFDEPGYSNTLTILDCKGAGTYVSTDLGTGKQIQNLEFDNVAEITTDSIFTYNEDTYAEDLRVEKYYRIVVSKTK
ncbi:MAG: hypothetical protein IPG60_11075 [Bacteroidetes bacterium]|nr:hypothetical protein [Bacteroidota bacterium]MBP7398926.1 hypothetical protein [Chitinophagales bacterium]MBK7109505.1 hypothetical protein [Bacteroidota bacterium]MBK8487758.1 hypothetical protein [Bacteroidota bacterium]MBK8682487.1 hypothetical protein [Bacteroidota bacterium]